MPIVCNIAVKMPNLNRRHLDTTQRSMVAGKLANLPNGLHKTAAEISAAVSQPEAAQMLNVSRESVQAAQIVGTNMHYVHDAKRIKEEAPEIFSPVKSGEISLTDAKRQIKEEKREVVREQNRELVRQAPPVAAIAKDVRYQTIVLDPPWDWGDEGDQDQMGRARRHLSCTPYLFALGRLDGLLLRLSRPTKRSCRL